MANDISKEDSVNVVVGRDMRKFVILFICVVTLLESGNAVAFTKQKINVGWEFRQENLGEWMPAKVPGVVQTDLLENKKIKDPYYADNYKRSSIN